MPLSPSMMTDNKKYLVSEDPLLFADIRNVPGILLIAGILATNAVTIRTLTPPQQRWCVSFICAKCYRSPSKTVSHTHNITPHIKPQNSLCSLLIVAPKDPMDKLDRSQAVYGLKCDDCSASYVGKSACPLRARICKHERPSFPVGEDAINKDHTINWDNVSILDRESDWYRRGVREAIHLKQTNSTLNKGQGQPQPPILLWQSHLVIMWPHQHQRSHHGIIHHLTLKAAR